MKKCYALQAQGKAGSWNCDAWAKETKNPKKLPQHSMTVGAQMARHYGKSHKIVHK